MPYLPKQEVQSYQLLTLSSTNTKQLHEVIFDSDSERDKIALIGDPVSRKIELVCKERIDNRSTMQSIIST